MLYGVGTMVGGGFHALLGKVAGYAGTLAPLSFLVAAVVASSAHPILARLVARYPHSGGPAHYVEAVFGRRQLSRLVGWPGQRHDAYSHSRHVARGCRRALPRAVVSARKLGSGDQRSAAGGIPDDARHAARI